MHSPYRNFTEKKNSAKCPYKKMFDTLVVNCNFAYIFQILGNILSSMHARDIFQRIAIITEIIRPEWLLNFRFFGQ